jgi:hypothetical protein
VTKPLELLPHVQYGDTLDIAFIAQKVQATQPLEPLDLQVVIDYLPKLMVSGRPDLARKLGQKPTPKIWMHLGKVNLNAAYDLLKQMACLVLVLQNDGKPVTVEGLQAQLIEWATSHFETFGGRDVAKTAKTALETITHARQGILQETAR